MARREISDLAFLFNIVPVMIINPTDRRGTGTAQYWYPPTEPGDFRRIDEESTGWCRWSARREVEDERIPTSEAGANDDVYTVFFNQENNHFLIVPLDCSRESIHRRRLDADYWPDRGWFRVMFKHLRDGRMSELTHDPSLNHHLGGRASSQWMPQLIPDAYDQTEYIENTGLTGKLSLLVAIAAFTSEFHREDFIRTMNHHFRPPRWIPRGGATPSVKTWPAAHDYGVIVRVRPDPKSGIGRAELSQFEKGSYGCLIN